MGGGTKPRPRGGARAIPPCTSAREDARGRTRARRVHGPGVRLRRPRHGSRHGVSNPWDRCRPPPRDAGAVRRRVGGDGIPGVPVPGPAGLEDVGGSRNHRARDGGRPARRPALPRQVRFAFPLAPLPSGSTVSWTVTAAISGVGQQTLGALVPSADALEAVGAIVTLTVVPTADPLGGVGGPPSTTAIDGGYGA